MYWILDGRLNHQGLESDDVELLPGKHDDAMLYAVGGSGQVVAESLPRVVKLPQVEIPEMVYGVNAWSLSWKVEWQTEQNTSRYWKWSRLFKPCQTFGFEFVRVSVWGCSTNRDPPNVEHFDWLFETMRDGTRATADRRTSSNCGPTGRALRMSAAIGACSPADRKLEISSMLRRQGELLGGAGST